MGSRNPLGTDPGGRPACEVAHLTIFHRIGAEGARMSVRIVGEIDMTTVPAFADALELARRAAAKLPELREIEVDLREVTFLSAAGLAELVRAHGRCAHDAVPLHAVADRPAVTRPLRLAGLDRVLGLRAAPDHREPAQAPDALPGNGSATGGTELPSRPSRPAGLPTR